MEARRGSVTLETAIVLPIVLVLVFSILMTTRVYNTYNRMDNALTQAAYSIANIAYPLKEMGFLDWQEGMDEAADDLENTIAGSIKDIQDVTMGAESKEVYKNMADAINAAVNGKKSTIQDWLDSFAELKTQFDNMLDLVGKMKEVAIDVLTALRDQVGNVDDYLYSQAKQMLVRWYVGHYVRDYLGVDYMKGGLYIRTFDPGMDGVKNAKLVNYQGSNAFYTYTGDVTINNLITLNAEYYLDIPYPIPVGDIYMKNSVTVRGMAGK